MALKQSKFILLLLLFVFLLTSCGTGETAETGKSVHIVMPGTSGIDNPETNYYKNWLEEQTGINIELELVSPEYMPEYLRLLFTPGNTSDVDAVFLSGEFISLDLIESYGQDGYILAMDDMIANGENISTVMKLFPTLHNHMAVNDGHFYYMPNFTYSAVFRAQQMLWMNSDWLQACGVSMPQTTEEFRQVLRAFKEGDPNGNGIEDDVPVAGNFTIDSQNICYYLMNAFVYTDPNAAFMAIKNGKVYFAPATDEWRDGLRYLKSLYDEGLLSNSCFTFSDKQFTRLINDPRDLTGGFTSHDIADVLAAGSPALASRYIHVPPLEGPEGVRVSTVSTNKPSPGGIITSYCQDPETVFALMDFMLGEEACMIAAFGEKGVDWDTAGISEIGFDGNPAVITVQSPEWDLVKNKNFSRLGPFVGYPAISDGVAWNGYQSDQRYLNARAARVYQEYEPSSYIGALQTTQYADEVRMLVGEYTKKNLNMFVIGTKDIEDDEEWQQYLDELESLHVGGLVQAVQAVYDASEREAQHEDSTK
ncbi:hypothetical protein LJC56_07485 [Christensenellaceae bacterium OttesenSCG-928-K19]|nr:hypothetical protein [Christensenellaceae bacterium OttesenSCG-928-K19]